MEITFNAENLSLVNTFSSSFACYLFKPKRTKNGTKWVGGVDPVLGAELIQNGEKVKGKIPTNSLESVTYLTRYVTGLWYVPRIQTKDERAREIVSLLSKEILPGVRVPKLFNNKWQVLMAAMLSIHARMDLSRLWFSSINGMDFHDLLKTSPSMLGKHIEKSTGKSAGFRVRFLIEMARDLHETYPDCVDPLDSICRKPIPEIRQELLNIRNIGPKVCDCFLLNAIGYVEASPVDVHVKRVAEYIGVLPPNLGHPFPRYCSQFVCSRESSVRYGLPLCPKAERTIEYLDSSGSARGTCVKAALARKFKDAGWIQALLFLFGQRFCVWKPRSGPSCESCPLKDYCSKDQIELSKPLRVRRRSARAKRKVSLRTGFVKIPLLELYPEEEDAVREHMKAILQKAKEKNLHLGTRGSIFAATCLWLACRSRNLPVLAKEVAQKYSVRWSDLLRLVSRIRMETELKIPLIGSAAFCERLRRAFILPDEVVHTAISLLKERRIFGKAPQSLAAAIVYLASEKLDQPIAIHTLSQALMLSTVTVSNTVKQLVKSGDVTGISEFKS